jgi:hypothetical protein
MCVYAAYALGGPLAGEEPVCGANSRSSRIHAPTLISSAAAPHHAPPAACNPRQFLGSGIRP